MVRAFDGSAVEPEALARVVDAGRRAPAAGNTREGRRFEALVGPETAAYWDATLPAGPGRDGFRWQGLLRAPALVVVCCSPAAYVARYAEPDKASALGGGVDAWAQPFWWIDAGMSVEAMLLQARAERLGACFFGLFDHEAAVLAALGVDESWRGVGTLAVGHPDHEADEPGRSATRLPPS